MKKELFDELLESVKEAIAIEHGTFMPTRTFDVIQLGLTLFETRSWLAGQHLATSDNYFFEGGGNGGGGGGVGA